MSIDPSLQTALRQVIDPELRRPITELGMVESAHRDEQGTVRVSILLTIEGCPMKNSIEADIRRALLEVPGVLRVHVQIGSMTPEQRQQLREQLGHTRTNPFAQPDSLTRVIAVASGKGGVGKSSVTVNLAASMASRGLSVGIVDADVHGFSVPGLLGITQAPTRWEDMILPPVVEVPQSAGGGSPASAAGQGSIRVISIGMFVEDNRPIAWRGPMLHRALEQFLTDVHFGDVDVLLLDLPPGTGDIAISMSHLLPGAELVIVSTPQQAAVEVAERAGTLSAQTGQQVAGVVENMSAMVLPDGSSLEMFGSGGGEQLAQRLSAALDAEVPLLGSVPLDLALREGGDEGIPVVWSHPDSPAAQVLESVAHRLLGRGRRLSGKRLPLNIA